MNILDFFTSKTELTERNVYGKYVIDVSRYPGKKADWQYEHYNFEITKDDTLRFHILEKGKIVKSYNRRIRFTTSSPTSLWTFDDRKDSCAFHIISKPPTLYRNVFTFYYVFNSRYYHNVFFKKK